MTAACAECTEYGASGYQPVWDSTGCLDGQVYGPCESELCGGLCEYVGRCDCVCHVRADG